MFEKIKDKILVFVFTILFIMLVYEGVCIKNVILDGFLMSLMFILLFLILCRFAGLFSKEEIFNSENIFCKMLFGFIVGFIYIIFREILFYLRGIEGTFIVEVPINDFFMTSAIFIVAVIMIPIGEELLYRGFLYKGFVNFFIRIKKHPYIKAKPKLASIVKGVGYWPNWLLISSLIFAKGHEGFNVVTTFVFGIMLVLLFIKTDNLTPCIIAHSLNNLFSFLQDGIKLF